jgi:preprotein translocase subunit SecG
VICLFLICLILIQKGKGGGLAGAFGGMGGSSAFGTKAGDVFTRVTVVVAAVWIFLSMILVVLYNQNRSTVDFGDTGTTLSREVTPKPARGKGAAPVPPAGPGAAPPAATTPAPATSSSPSAPVSAEAIPDAAPPKSK